VIVTLKPLVNATQSARRIPRHAAPTTRKESIAHAGILVFIALLVPLHRWWAIQVLLVPMLLIVPGVILLRALRIPGQVVSSFPAYVPCASIVVLFGSGLAVDLLGPLVGAAAPLRPVPLLIGFEITCFALLAASAGTPSNAMIEWRSFSRPGSLLWPLILPLVAAVGALRLNSGRSNTIAMIAICAFIVLLVTTTVLSSRLNQSLLRVALYAAGLATVWSDSLRGDPLYGFDIATEYQRMQQTILTGIWHTAHPNDAYGAMLSVTVMPTEFHALSGISGLLVFKVVYPMIYAFFPVAIFDLGRRILSCRWAFVAAIFTIGQYAFPEMAGFARQQIALVFFAALIAAMLESRIRRRMHWTLVALLGLATALSHYSTTYVAITVIGLILPLQWVVSWFREIPRVTGAVAVAFIAVCAGATIWYWPVTHSNSHVLQVTQTVEAQGLNILPNRVPGGSLLSAYLQGNTKTPIEARQYARLVHSYYSVNKPYIKAFPDADISRYALRDSPVPETPVKWHLGYDGLSISLLIIEQLANLLAVIGALLMVLRRRASVVTRQVGLLALTTTLLLAILRFSGTLALAYGQERAQLQGWVLLAITLSWVMQGIAGARKARQTRVLVITAACLALVFVNTSYLISAIFGGTTSINLANSGKAFEYYYFTAPEIDSARWLGRAVQAGQLVYADEYGQLPLNAVTGIQRGLFVDLTPQTLNQTAWVYASRTNVIEGRAFALYKEHLATYVFPSSFLSSHYNLVYTNGSSEVFHR
jgi:uncharacterized membrane protein